MKLIAKALAFLFKRSVTQDDPEVAKAQAQIEIEEARAFRKGKLSPKYLLKYLSVFLIALFCTLFIIGLFFPDIIDISHFLDTVVRVLSMVEGA